MTRTFEEMCAERDPLYAAMQPSQEFEAALECDRNVAFWSEVYGIRAGVAEERRFGVLARLVVAALRNQGQPYYDARQS